MTNNRHPDWDLEDPLAYSPEKFYPHIGSGKNKESIATGTRLSPYMHRAISEIVESKKYPEIKTSADFLRDAVYHRMKYLSTHDVEINSTLAQIQRMHANAEHERDMLTFQEAVETTASNIWAVHNLGVQERDYEKRLEFEDKAERMLTQALRDLNGIKSEFWRSVYLSDLQQRVGRIFPDVRGMFSKVCEAGEVS